VEAPLDAAPELSKHGVRDIFAIRGGPFGSVVPAGDGDRTLEGTYDVAETDLEGRSRKVVAAARPPFGADQPRALQILKDLLEETRRNGLTRRYVLDLRWPPVVMEGDVEEGAHAVAPLIRELHARDLDCRIGYVKNRP